MSSYPSSSCATDGSTNGYASTSSSLLLEAFIPFQQSLPSFNTKLGSIKTLLEPFESRLSLASPPSLYPSHYLPFKHTLLPLNPLLQAPNTANLTSTAQLLLPLLHTLPHHHPSNSNFPLNQPHHLLPHQPNLLPPRIHPHLHHHQHSFPHQEDESSDRRLRSKDGLKQRSLSNCPKEF